MSEAKRPAGSPEERLGEALQDWLGATDVAGPEAGSEVGAGRDDLDLLFDLLDGRLSAEEESSLRGRLRDEPELAEQWREVQASVADLLPARDAGASAPAGDDGEGPAPRNLVWFAAAAVLVLTSVWWIWNTVQLGQGEVLASAAREDVQRVLRAGSFDLPESVAELRPATGTLRDAQLSADGSVGNGRPRPLGPVGTWIRPYPEFRWLAVEGAESYSLVVTDLEYEEIARVEGLEDTTWQPRRDWPPGRLLVWQVTAELADGSIVRAPVPPEPEARFGVLAERDLVPVERLLGDVEAAVGLTSLERAVARARIYAEAGLMAAAASELGSLSVDERSAEVEALERSLSSP